MPEVDVQAIDVRTPADTQDQQTTDAKSAVPPVEFIVTRGPDTNVVQIYDRQGPQNRLPTVSYRVYFLPEAFSPIPVGTPGNTLPLGIYSAATRTAAQRVASLVTDVSAPGLGTVLKYSDTVNFQARGFYFCVAVNRAGVEAPPEHVVTAP